MAFISTNHRLASIGVIALIASLVYAQPQPNNRGSSRNWPPGTSDYAKSEFTATEISSQRCKMIGQGANAKLRDCGGVAGYRLLYRGREERPELFVASPQGKQFSIPYWNPNADNFLGLSKTVEWGFIRYENRIEPLVLVLGAEIKPDEFVRFRGPYSIIVKLTRNEVCPIGRVPTSPYSGMDTASLISTARSRKCVGRDDVTRKDWLGVVFGLAANGRYDEATSAIRQIKSSGERVVAYKNIAEAQAKADDVAAARRTLIQGLEEAHRPLTGLEDEFTVIDPGAVQNNTIVIVYAFATVGLYDDLKELKKLIDQDHIADALLTIARIQGLPDYQGGRGDLSAAKATLQEAFELACRQDVNTADSHLQSVAYAQAELGFTAEAKKTVELIKNASAKEAAERSIEWWLKARRP